MIKSGKSYLFSNDSEAHWLTKKKISFVLRLNKNTLIKPRYQKYQSLSTLNIKPGERTLYSKVKVTESERRERFNVVVYWRRKYKNKHQKWWELIMSAYLMICLHSKSFNPVVAPISEIFQEHELWDTGSCWKSLLNNIQLILQPYRYFNLILKWLKIFPIPQLTLGFPRLIGKINEVDYLHYLVYLWDDFYYSSA